VDSKEEGKRGGGTYTIEHLRATDPEKVKRRESRLAEK
jgi:hypothetical protein